MSTDGKMRSNAFSAFGALSKYGTGAERDAFLEQVLTPLSTLKFNLIFLFLFGTRNSTSRPNLESKNIHLKDLEMILLAWLMFSNAG